MKVITKEISPPPDANTYELHITGMSYEEAKVLRHLVGCFESKPGCDEPTAAFRLARLLIEELTYFPV